MRNYFIADLFRLRRSKLIALTLIITVIVFAAAVFLIKSFNDAPQLPNAYEQLIGVVAVFLPLIYSIVVFNFVYGQDIKAGTYRVAIGRGNSRATIVLIKIIETFVLSLSLYALLGGIFWGLPQLLGYSLGESGGMSLLAMLVASFITNIVFIAIAGIVALGRQQTTMALVLLVLLVTMVAEQMIKVITTIPFVADLLQGVDIAQYLPSQVAQEFGQMIAGQMSFAWYTPIAILLYVLGAYVLTRIIFKNKELEF